MTEQNFGTIAALQFCVPPSQGFEDIVEELDISFRPYGLTRRTLTWDSEDIAIIERDSLRVLLGWLPAVCKGMPSFLVFAVGHATNGGNLLVNRETCEFVKEVLIEHLGSYLNFETVFHAEATQPVETDLVDTVTEILHRDFATPATRQPPRDENIRGWTRDRAYTRDIAQQKGRRKTRLQDLEVLDFDIETDVDTPSTRMTGTALPDEMSLPKRLTIYTLGATILIYTPPVGAFVLVYSTLRDLMPRAA
mgnify:CR=1 FL=1